MGRWEPAGTCSCHTCNCSGCAECEPIFTPADEPIADPWEGK